MSSQSTAKSNDSNTEAEPLGAKSAHSASAVEPQGAKSLMVVLGLAVVLIFFAAAIPVPIRAAWDQFSLRMQ